MTVSTSTDTLKPSAIGHFVTGTLVSLCNISTFHPLFTIKTLVMSNVPIRAKALYAGYSANLTCDITNQAVAFCAFGVFQETVSKWKNRPLTSGERIIGGLVAGTCAAPLLSTFERIMIIQQVHDSLGNGLKGLTATEVARKIWEQETWKGLFRGLSPTFVRESLNSACFFGLSKMYDESARHLGLNTTFTSNLSYLLAGVSAGFLTTPLDLVKTRMQKDISRNRPCFWETVSSITDNRIGNVYKLYRGAIPRMMMLGATMTGMGFFSEVVAQRLPKYLLQPNL